jgi:hypothetical protein
MARIEILRRRVLPAATIMALFLLPDVALAQTAETYSKEAMEQALETKQRYDLYGVHFDVDKATIKPDTEPLLDDIATALRNFPSWQLRIVGHTDATGDSAHNEQLSLARAEAIKEGLLKRGIAAWRLETEGAGQSQPVASNDTSEGQALNRRVELARFTSEPVKLLKAMSDYMSAQDALSVEIDSTLEVVTTDRQKLALASSGSVTLQRPDKIRATRTGGFASIESVFDGKTLTILGKNKNAFTRVEIPGSVDHLIDELKDKYNMPLPAADLLLSNSFAELMQDVVVAKDAGSGIIRGTECDHLAFRNRDFDWQIWITQGDEPVPCRFTITSTTMDGSPQYDIQFGTWKKGVQVTDRDFTFKAPPGAVEIDPKALSEASDLPENFKIGGDQ